jgi:hypothetical protein
MGGAFPPADRQPRDDVAGPSCCYRRAHDDPAHGARGHRGRRPRGRDGVLRRARTQAAGRGAGRGRLGGPRGGARGRPGGDRDGGDPGRPRTARADEVSRPAGPGRRPARAGEHPGHAMSPSPSTTSTPSSRACEPAARSSLARWSATKTAIGSATSAARRGSSSSWPNRPADGSGRPEPPRQRQRSSRGRIPMCESPGRYGSRGAGWPAVVTCGSAHGTARARRQGRQQDVMRWSNELGNAPGDSGAL